MDWKKPEMVEVNMSAEIGAYQDDFGGDREDPPFVSPSELLPIPEQP